MDVSQIIATWTPPTQFDVTAGGGKAEELKDASQQFEAVLLRQYLGQALKPLLHDSLGSNAPGAHIYQHMLTDAIASQLASEETFGMSSLLQMQLAGAVEPESTNEERSEK